MRKNRLAFTIAALMSITLVYAASSPITLRAATGPDFSIGSLGEVVPGQTVTLPIIVSNNPGFAATGLAVAYDPNALEITGVTGAVADMPLNSQFALTTTPGAQWVSLVNPNGADWYGNGTVANVTFYVKPGATLGSKTVSLSFITSPNGTPAAASGTVLAGSSAASGGVYIASGGNNYYNGGGGYYYDIPAASYPSGAAGNSSSSSGGTSTSSGTGGSTGGNSAAGSNSVTAPGGTSNAPAADNAAGNGDNLYADNSGFIGDAGISGNAAFDSGVTYVESANTPSASASFGKVPQTGTPDIAALVAAMCVCLFTAMLMGVCIIRLNHRGRSNG